jgi:hypothetical protein
VQSSAVEKISQHVLASSIEKISQHVLAKTGSEISSAFDGQDQNN